MSYATCGDASAERLVEERIAKCCKAFESAVAKLARSGVGAASIGGGAKGQGATPVARFQVCMGFYQRRVKQVWFQKSEEKVYWEQWQLPLAIVRPGLQGELTNSAARAERQNALQVRERCWEPSVRQRGPRRVKIVFLSRGMTPERI